MSYNVHAGHNPDGKVACGAVGLIKESTEARIIKDYVIKYLKAANKSVHDCTVNDGKSSADVLKKIVTKCNKHDVDIDVSIHLNSGANDKKGNNKSTGVEVLVYSDKSKAYDEAKRICDKLSKLGFKNRGVKVRPDLYVLRKSESPALLIEVAFCDDKDDVAIFNKNKAKIGKLIAEALVNKTINIKPTEFKVKIKVDELNVRSGAGTDFKVNTTVKENEVYTIVDTSGNWGKLKSGAGWININSKYVDRV